MRGIWCETALEKPAPKRKTSMRSYTSLGQAAGKSTKLRCQRFRVLHPSPCTQTFALVRTHAKTCAWVRKSMGCTGTLQKSGGRIRCETVCHTRRSELFDPVPCASFVLDRREPHVFPGTLQCVWGAEPRRLPLTEPNRGRDASVVLRQ